MKIFVRLFASILTLILLSFAVFGTWLFYSSFQVLLNRELDSNTNNTKMIAYALLSSVDAVGSEYTPEEEDYRNIMEALAVNFSGQTEGVALYDSVGTVIFDKGIAADKLNISDVFADAKEQMAFQKMTGIEDKHYIISYAVVMLQGREYMLAVSSNVEYLYEYRQKMYRQYLEITGAVIVLAGAMSFLLAYHFARRISVLSQASISLANGNYDKRIPVTGNDEITDMMRSFNFMARRLSENIRELEDSARRQEEFTGAFAHELKTPLTAIIGYSEMLQTMELSERERQVSAKYIYQQGKRLEHLAYSMLALSSMDNEVLQMREISVRQVVREAYGTLKFVLKREHIRFVMDVADSGIVGEKDLLVTLVCNLIDNARKACSKESKEIKVKGFVERDFYILKVIDNGCGIPEEDIGKVREAFYMVDKSRSRKAGGVGLGLALCSKIVELHGGNLHIQSVLGEGTTVTITLSVEGEYAGGNNGMEVR